MAAVKNNTLTGREKKRQDRAKKVSYEQAAALIERGSRRLYHFRMGGLTAETVLPMMMMVKLTQVADQLRELAADRYQSDLYFLLWSGMNRKLPMKELFEEMEVSRRAFVRWQKSPPEGAQYFTITKELEEKGDWTKWKIVIRLATVQRTAQLLYEAYRQAFLRQGVSIEGEKRIDQTHPGVTADLVFKALTNNLG